MGGGTAGCVVATRLVEAGRRVVLLEAGPDYGAYADGAWPADLLDAAGLPTSHDWGYTGHGAGGQSLVYDRARVLGGCSSHNGCTQSAGWAGDWDQLGEQVGGEWSADVVAAHVARIRERMRMREYGDDEVQPLQAAFLDACGRSGLPLADDFLDLHAGAGAGCAPVNIEGDARINTAIAYLDSVRGNPLLTVVGGAMVERVLIGSGRAVGVDYQVGGQRHHVASDLVVVCAGAYGSPETLLRSGIGPASHLESLGIDVAHELPGVGESLRDHPAAELRFAGTAKLAESLAEFARTRWLPEEQAVAKVCSPQSDAPYDLHIYPWIEEDQSRPHGWQVIIPVAQVRPRSRGTVRLASSDATALGVIDPQFFSDEEGADLASVVFGVRWVLDELLGGVLGSFVGEQLGVDVREMDDAALRQWIREQHAHYWHPVGGCIMGRDSDDRAVTDGNGRVHGVAGLWVADASVFPEAPRATTALPTVVVAEQLAQRLA